MRVEFLNNSFRVNNEERRVGRCLGAILLLGDLEVSLPCNRSSKRAVALLIIAGRLFEGLVIHYAKVLGDTGVKGTKSGIPGEEAWEQRDCTDVFLLLG